MIITCPNCGNSQEYRSRSKKSPKRPSVKCKHCHKNIYFKLGKLRRGFKKKTEVSKLKNESSKPKNIEITKFPSEVSNLKKLRFQNSETSTSEPINIEKRSFQMEYSLVLLFLNKEKNGMYARQLASFINDMTYKQIWSILRKMLKINLVKESDNAINRKTNENIYQITEFGIKYLNNTRILPPEFDEHCTRFKNDLLKIPKWILNTKFDCPQLDDMFIVKKSKPNGWNKYIMEVVNTKTFNGMSSVEICKNVVIYNFNREPSECHFKSKADLINFEKERIMDCKRMRLLLESRDFEIDKKDPTRAQKGHYVIVPEDLYRIGNIDKNLNIEIDDGKRKITQDNTPKDGSIENDNQNDVINVYNQANNVAEMRKDIQDLRNEFREFKTEMTGAIRDLTNTLKEIFLSSKTDNSNENKENKSLFI
jgi:DNA-binding PadR family transcriptional regulator